MIPDNLGRYKQELLAKQAELEVLLRTLDSIAVQHAADEIDNVQLSGEREFAINRLERWTALLGEVREALNRIPSGTYGVCSACDEAINSRRLMAVPWTAYCLQCQMDRDRRAQEARAEEPIYPFTSMRPKCAAEGYDLVRRRRKAVAAGGYGRIGERDPLRAVIHREKCRNYWIPLKMCFAHTSCSHSEGVRAEARSFVRKLPLCGQHKG